MGIQECPHGRAVMVLDVDDAVWELAGAIQFGQRVIFTEIRDTILSEGLFYLPEPFALWIDGGIPDVLCHKGGCYCSHESIHLALESGRRCVAVVALPAEADVTDFIQIIAGSDQRVGQQITGIGPGAQVFIPRILLEAIGFIDNDAYNKIKSLAKE